MTLAKLLNKPQAIRYFTPDNRFILPDCRIGLEFEFEHTGITARNRGLPVTPWSHYWEWHEEGSIRDNGSEFVFVEPLFGRDAILAIEGLCQFADDNRWRSTLRTGLHVHLDVRDMEAMQLVGMCVLYAIFEPAIFRWIADNRENSHFCVPWYKAEVSVLEAADIIKSAVKPVDGVNEDLLESAGRYQRYAAFNLQALHRFGSIEARHMRTCTDVRRIMDWINILMGLKRATQRIPHSDVAIVRTVENLGPVAALESILGSEFLFLLYKDFAKDVTEVGIPTANELIREGLTVNLWEQLNAPRGENDGFRRFMADHVARAEGREFEEPEEQRRQQEAQRLINEMRQRELRDQFIPNLFWDRAAQALAPQEAPPVAGDRVVLPRARPVRR